MSKNTIVYTPRAFHYDASLAMKGDIVRGLIEAITNADDAYGDESGKIRIEVEHRRQKSWKVIVRDRATGMSAARMKSAIGTLGGRTSGFEEGRSVRGNLGRGAKDLAWFGPVTFESIRDGNYASLTLEEDGTFENPLERKASPDDYKSMGIKRSGSGTVVTIEVREQVRCPLHDNLKDKLSNNYQLRDINSDPHRDVTLVDLNSDREDSIRYGRPSLEEVVYEEIEIEGFVGSNARLTIWKNIECYENRASDPERPEGILIVGRRAIYENTLFGFESNPHSGWFSGRLECFAIDDLAREYDERLQSGVERELHNPMPIISRDRDGLEHEHPLYKALTLAVDARLAPLIEAEKQKSQSGEVKESPRMRRTLQELGRDLGKMINEDLRELDEDSLTGAGDDDNDAMLKVIPEDVIMYMGEDKTVSVVVSRRLGVTSICAEVDPEGVVELSSGMSSELWDHPRREDFLIGRIRLRPLIEDEDTFLIVRAGDEEASALIEVRPERFDPDPQPPTTFQFEREYYQLTHGKRRKLVIQAPLELTNEHGVEARVVSLVEGIVVMHGGVVRLEFDEDLLFYRGEIEVDPRSLGVKGQLRATLGELQAKCVVNVTSVQSGPQIEIKILDKFAGKFRAEVISMPSGSVRMEICGQHPVLKRYLGPGPEFPNQDAVVTKAVLAEIIASEAARFVVERKYPNIAEIDGAEFYSEHRTYLEKYLNRCHKMMLSDGEI